jgi:polar amino acid transport system permease protein
MENHVVPTGTEMPGRSSWSRLAAIDRWWALVLVVLIMIVLLIRTSPEPFGTMFQFLSDGIVVTLKITVTSFGTVLVVGLFGGLGRLSRNWLIKGIASLYVEVVRGIPLLVQLLFIWFALPQVLDTAGGWLVNIWPAVSQWLIDLKLEPFSAAVLGITVCYGAYMSEIYRAGIQSIHYGQMEAARSLGMSYVQAMRYVVLPQAIRVILPPVGNEFVTLLKDSSLVSVLAVSDLTRRGREYMARTFLSFETWMMVALIYLVLTLTFTRIATAVERRMSIGNR